MSKLALKKLYRYRWFIIVVLVLMVPMVILASLADSYRSDPSSIIAVTARTDSKDYFLENNSKHSFFVPNRTSSEWQSFATSLPAGLTLTLDPDPCDSVEFTCGDVCVYNNQNYNTVAVGSQCWFNQDLRTHNYPDGSSMSFWTYGTEQLNLVPARFACADSYDYCENDETEEVLYKWYAALPEAITGGTDALLREASTDPGLRGSCPSGWRVPSLADLEDLKLATPGCFVNNDYFDKSCLEGNFGLRLSLNGLRSYDGINRYKGAGYYLTSNFLVGHHDTPIIMRIYGTFYPQADSEYYNAYAVRCIQDFSGGDIPGGREGGESAS